MRECEHAFTTSERERERECALLNANGNANGRNWWTTNALLKLSHPLCVLPTHTCPKIFRPLGIFAESSESTTERTGLTLVDEKCSQTLTLVWRVIKLWPIRSSIRMETYVIYHIWGHWGRPRPSDRPPKFWPLSTGARPKIWGHEMASIWVSMILAWPPDFKMGKNVVIGTKLANFYFISTSWFIESQKSPLVH